MVFQQCHMNECIDIFQDSVVFAHMCVFVRLKLKTGIQTTTNGKREAYMLFIDVICVCVCVEDHSMHGVAKEQQINSCFQSKEHTLCI